MTKAIFPGSFDPFTLGHLDIVTRAAKMFDEVIIAVGASNTKNYLFSLQERVELVRSEVSKLKNVKVISNDGLTVGIAKKQSAKVLVRALRSSSDFDYEKPVAEANSKLWNEIETIFIIARPELSCVSSTLVKEIAKNKGDVSEFVSKGVASALKKKFSIKK